jgi:hypothetical protein
MLKTAAPDAIGYAQHRDSEGSRREPLADRQAASGRNAPAAARVSTRTSTRDAGPIARKIDNIFFPLIGIRARLKFPQPESMPAMNPAFHTRETLPSDEGARPAVGLGGKRSDRAVSASKRRQTQRKNLEVDSLGLEAL